jgi:lia operon protein LiaG
MKLLMFLSILFVGTNVHANGTREDSKEEIKIDGVDNIELITSSGDIEVITERRNNILVELVSYKNGPKLFIDRGRSLKIEVKKKAFPLISFSRRGRVKLTVTIPEQYRETLVVKSSSGDVYLEKMELDDLEVNLSSGDLTVKEITANEGSFKTSSGDQELEDLTIENLDLYLSSGSLSLIGDIDNINARLSSGSADVKLEELTGDMDFRLSSGDFLMEFIDEDVDAELDLKTSSGEINVGFPVTIEESGRGKELSGTAGSGDYMIVVQNSSGDITLR